MRDAATVAALGGLAATLMAAGFIILTLAQGKDHH